MLEVSDLSFGFRFRPIFAGVSFSLDSGQMLHIQGPNGCGKTTLMSILAGLKQANSGSITFKQAHNALPEDLRKHAEYLPAEANALYGKMDAMQNLKFWLNLRGHKAKEEVLTRALERWDLGHKLIRSQFPVEKFSTGMKRRLALARVELSNTRLWLLDEPLYGLDAKGIETFQQAVKTHLESGGSVLIVSHEVSALAMFHPQALLMPGKKG